MTEECARCAWKFGPSGGGRFKGYNLNALAPERYLGVPTRTGAATSECSDGLCRQTMVRTHSPAEGASSYGPSPPVREELKAFRAQCDVVPGGQRAGRRDTTPNSRVDTRRYLNDP